MHWGVELDVVSNLGMSDKYRNSAGQSAFVLRSVRDQELRLREKFAFGLGGLGRLLGFSPPLLLQFPASS